MPGIKNLEDRMDICCENIRTRILTMESYGQDAHAVDVNGLLSLAQTLKTVDINQQLLLCDNTIRIINELKHLLKDEERRRSLEIQLLDSERANNKKLETKQKITAERREKRFNPYQIEAPPREQRSMPITRQSSK